MMGEGEVLMKEGRRGVWGRTFRARVAYICRLKGGGDRREVGVVVVEPAGAKGIKDKGSERSPAWKARVSGRRAGSFLATPLWRARVDPTNVSRARSLVLFIF